MSLGRLTPEENPENNLFEKVQVSLGEMREMRSVSHRASAALALACLGCLVAIASFSRGPAELLQQKPAGQDWLGSVMNNALAGLSDSKLVDGQQLSATAGPEKFGGARIRHAKAPKPVVHSRLNKLGVNMNSWPAVSAEAKDSLIADLKTAFSDLPHANPLIAQKQLAALKAKDARAGAKAAATGEAQPWGVGVAWTGTPLISKP